MEPVPCASCSSFFKPRNRLQSYCSKPDCQRVRKAAWQKQKLRTDPEYRENQRLSQKKWTDSNPGYWRSYRKQNPEKAERNRVLQKLRNHRLTVQSATEARVQSDMIAKMDASKMRDFKLLGS